ncbi:hypothetical protein ACJRO7_017309 [Eucalyptus globulus]|uniref:RNA-binding protein 48 n=1 Tax=Eucalyptus globulus TaxID=34317 RepID=A0ABD3KW21_EUCGL
MPPYKDEPPTICVYTVCDESRYLIVRNVPGLGCGDELLNLFATYGDVEECKPMDEEDCEPYTDVYWIKFHLDCNATLQVSYASHFESLSDTREKLEARRKEVLTRLNSERFKGTATSSSVSQVRSSANASSSQNSAVGQQIFNQAVSCINSSQPYFLCGASASPLILHADSSPYTRVSLELDYFQSHSMNQTVRLVRDKLNKIESSGEHSRSGPAAKKAHIDNRRRI